MTTGRRSARVSTLLRVPGEIIKGPAPHLPVCLRFETRCPRPPTSPIIAPVTKDRAIMVLLQIEALMGCMDLLEGTLPTIPATARTTHFHLEENEILLAARFMVQGSRQTLLLQMTATTAT